LKGINVRSIRVLPKFFEGEVMKNFVYFGVLFVLSIGSYSYADQYTCRVHRTPGLKCGGYDYGEYFAPLSVDSRYLQVGKSLSSYAGAATIPADINAPCEEFAQNEIVPMYIFEVGKTNDNQLQLTVMESVLQNGNSLFFKLSKFSKPMGTPMISTPVFKDSAVGKVSMSYECTLSGSKL
jgi:hypothetical protein